MEQLPRIADLFTLSNLSCGLAAILCAAHGEPTWACGLVLLAAVFDVFDGLVARATGGGSDLGAELDSLADMVSFAVAPSVMVFFAMKSGLSLDGNFSISLLPAPIILTCASAWRLAKFNIDTRQTMGFLGLPTPANALFWVSLVAISAGIAIPGAGADMPELMLKGFFGNKVVITLTALLFGVLMVSELPLPGIKFKTFTWKSNEVPFILLILGATMGVIWQAMAVPPFLLLYLLSPIWGRLFKSET